MAMADQSAGAGLRQEDPLPRATAIQFMHKNLTLTKNLCKWSCLTLFVVLYLLSLSLPQYTTTGEKMFLTTLFSGKARACF